MHCNILRYSLRLVKSGTGSPAAVPKRLSELVAFDEAAAVPWAAQAGTQGVRANSSNQAESLQPESQKPRKTLKSKPKQNAEQCNAMQQTALTAAILLARLGFSSASWGIDPL